MTNYAEVQKKFPNLSELEEGNTTAGNPLWTPGTVSQLDSLINQQKDKTLQITWYHNFKDYEYAVGSPLRYMTVELPYVIGKVVTFDAQTGMMTLRILENVAEDVLNFGNIFPRALIQKLGENEMKLHNLICIDIIQSIGGKEDERLGLEESVQNVEGGEGEHTVPGV